MHPAIYLFNHATKSIGRGHVYPQNTKMSSGYDYTAPNSVRKLKSWRFPESDPNFESIIVTNGAKLTDYISSVPIPYYVKIVSKKLLDILLSFKIPPHRVYEMSVIHKEERIEGYYGLYLLDNKEYYEYIDFEKSILWITEIITHKKIKLLEVKTAEELFAKALELVKQNTRLTIWAENLVMQDMFYDKAEMFSFLDITFPPEFYVTETIKTAVEDQKCTGIDFKCVSSTREEIKDFFGQDTHTFFPS
jgi:hypothetical protein